MICLMSVDKIGLRNAILKSIGIPVLLLFGVKYDKR